MIRYWIRAYHRHDLGYDDFYFRTYRKAVRAYRKLSLETYSYILIDKVDLQSPSSDIRIANKGTPMYFEPML